MSNQLSQDDLFLSTYYQTKVEESEYYTNLPSEETHPFDNKYKARKILETILLAKDVETLSPENQAVAKGIVQYILALNFFDTEENSQAEKHFIISLELFTQLSRDRICYFFNYIQDIYNSLGIIHTNREDIENGLGLFCKAESLYFLMRKIHGRNPVTPVHSLRYLRPSKDVSQKFRFFHQGGIHMPQSEKSYTLTLFYMAQAYAKIGMKSKAAQYCGWTLKRQFETNDYEMKDWTINCLSLAEFYNANCEFAQSQYLLMAGLSIIPDDSKKKLHATFYMSLGHHLLEYLGFAIEKYLAGEQDDPATNETLNKNSITFSNIKMDFIKLKLPKTVEEISAIFRMMNTQCKKALKHYELDGYVTEYLQIVRDISRGYRYLSLVEKDGDRIMALLERRRELIEYPYTEINPKAYELYWQQLCLELAEIYNEMFERKYERIAKGEEKLKKSTLEVLNKAGLASIEYFEKLIHSVVSSGNKEALENQDTLKTLITAKFNVAKNYSRLEIKDVKEKVNALKKSLEAYNWIKTFITENILSKGALNHEMRETLKHCEEMCSLLPAKIDKVNYQAV